MFDKKIRNQQIFLCRKNGMTFAEIACQFDLSYQRVRQIYFQEKYRRGPAGGFAGQLSTRTRSILERCYGRGILARPDILRDIGAAELKMLNGIGKSYMEEIARALEMLELIKDQQAWLND